MTSHLSTIELFLGVIVAASSCGLIYTARDFYKMKDEIYKEMDHKYVSKRFHDESVANLKEEIKIFADNQNDIKEKVDKIYDLLIRRQL
nr:MAG TPA: hypothetical protein [Caudoviricetes sp.]